MKNKDTIILMGCNHKLKENIQYRDHVDYLFVGKALKSYLDNDPEYMRLFNETNGLELLEIHNLQRMSHRYLDYVAWLKHGVPQEVTRLVQLDFCTYFDKGITKVFPYKSILEMFEYKAYMSSFAYMVAYSIMKGYSRIELYGINMIYGDDYIQKYNFEAWLTYAMARGIEVSVTDKSDLLKCNKNYGYEVDNTLGVYMSKHLEARKTHLHDGMVATSTALEALYKLNQSLKLDIETIYKDQSEFMRQIYNRHGLDPIVSGKSEFCSDDTND